MSEKPEKKDVPVFGKCAEYCEEMAEEMEKAASGLRKKNDERAGYMDLFANQLKEMAGQMRLAEKPLKPVASITVRNAEAKRARLAVAASRA